MSGFEWSKIPGDLNIQDSKRIAQELLTYSGEIAEKLFASGDLTGYLELQSRIPFYGYNNLLLIYEQYPRARSLAGYVIWKKVIEAEGGGRILKPEWTGKTPICLIAPFTDSTFQKGYQQKSIQKLVWYTAKVYDISQTNASHRPDPFAYIEHSSHLDLLLDAVSILIGTYFNRRIITERSPSSLSVVKTPGQVTEHTVSVYSDVSKELKLHWLTENLLYFSVSKDCFSEKTYQLLIQSICFCLLRIWKIESVHLPVIPKNSFLIVPREEQEPFLDLLQKTVFWVNQQVSCAYLAYRKEEKEDFLDSEILPF